MLKRIILTLQQISRDIPLVFLIHPRTRLRLNNLNISNGKSQLHFVEPMGYLDFLTLQRRAVLVITDSGGIQKETSYLGTPFLTIRENTERPVIVKIGTNKLVGQDIVLLIKETHDILGGRAKKKCHAASLGWTS